MKYLLTFLAALVLMACASSAVKENSSPKPKGSAGIVAYDLVYSSARNVPDALRHMVNWHTGSGLVYFAVNSLGHACVIDGPTYTMLYRGKSLTCEWRPMRHRGV